MRFDVLYEQLAQRLLLEQAGYTALYPGGYKPPHRGHYELAKAYATDPAINKVVILMGPTARGTITCEQAEQIWNDYYIGTIEGNVELQKVGNPYTAAYEYVDAAVAGQNFCFVASMKDEGDAARSQKFADDHAPGAKYHKPGINVVHHPKDTVAVYEGRSDDLNGKSISASQMREDIKKYDVDNFKTNLPLEVESYADDILKLLTSCI